MKLSQSNPRPLHGRIFLHIPQERYYDKNGIIIDTKWDARQYAPQYSKVIAVSPEITDIKVGDMIYHHDQVAQKGYLVDGEEDIFWCEYNDNDTIGTDERMFFDNILTEPIYKKESREVIIGGVGSAILGDFNVQEVKEYEKNKIRVIRGKGLDGKIFYCSNLVAYVFKRGDKMMYFSKYSQLICDEDLNCTPNKTIIRRDSEDFKLNKGLWVKQNEKVKTGTVVSSHRADLKEGTRIMYGIWKQFEYNGEMLDVAKDDYLFGTI
jgi:co-chaperonin GroES (HSP10)